MKTGTIFLLLGLALPLASLAQKDREYHPDEKTTVRIRPDYAEQRVFAEVNNSGKEQELALTESMTRTDRKITFADYNFDGLRDFSVSVPDDGMGVYHIYDVFLYDRQKKTFYPLPFPSDGPVQCDQFCDLKINSGNKTLSSTCRGGADWHKDVFRYGKDGSLQVVPPKERKAEDTGEQDEER